MKRTRQLFYKDNNKYELFKLIDGVQYKLCTKCLKYKPLTSEFFAKRKNVRCGYDSHCIECLKEKEKNRPKRIEHIKDGKVLCKRCGEYKNPEDFYVGPYKCRMYRSYYCKKCEIERRKEREYKLKDVIDDDIEKYVKRILSGCRTRVNQKSLKYDLDIDFIIDLYNKQNGKCSISGLNMTHYNRCGYKYPFNMSIDRINPGGNYTKDNVRLVCNIVNEMRMDYTDKFLIFISKCIYENNKHLISNINNQDDENIYKS